MRIIDLINRNRPFISLEFFPPKEVGEWPAFFHTVDRLRAVNPLFVSVTYGAGGSTQAHTLEIVTRLKREFHLEPMAHLTCVGASNAYIEGFLEELRVVGVDNVLALRGDMPPDGTAVPQSAHDFRHACDLVQFIRAGYPQMGVGVAGYPEGHPEAECGEEDLAFLKYKLDHGGDFVITQLFFDNAHYWDFVARVRGMGIEKPIIPGVMPIFSLKSIHRILSLCGASIPPAYLAALQKAEESGGADAVQVLGIEYARRQAQELLDMGAPGVHLYTLNRDEACIELLSGLKGL